MRRKQKKIKGKRYTVLADDFTYVERGLLIWKMSYMNSK